MRHILVFFIAFFSFFISPQIITASEGWTITDFQSNITIENTGKVRVDEIIPVDFYDLSKHGIYRDIPYVYESNGNKTYTEVSVEKVLQNNSPAKYEIIKNDANVRIKIGDPNRTISGKNTYEIIYTVTGVLKSFSGYDELYWNATGNNWEAAIIAAHVTVTLPSDGFKQTACYQGVIGSNTRCSAVIINPNTAQFSSTGSLDASEGLTIAAGYKKGLVPILTVQKPKTFFDKFFSWPSQITLLIVLLSGIGTVLYLWYKYGRDYWFAANIFGTKDEQGSVKPIGGHETVVVEFIPPDKLRPAEIGVVTDERADTLDVVATIIDLATRGYLTVTEVPKKWIFGNTDYVLTKTKNENQEKQKLLGYEHLLLDKLFAEDDTVTVSELKTTFYEELKEVKDELYKEVNTKNLFPTNPEKVRQKYFIIAVLLLFAGFFFGFFGINTSIIFFADLAAGIIISGIILAIVSQFMPRKTAYGRDIYRRIKGYQLFISKAEKYRQQFFERKNMFNEVLPYAIVFGLTEKFAKAMQDMGVKTPQTGWYVGTHPFTMSSFGSSMNEFSKSLSSAIAATPQSSGSFGGGSSGGGFGGGGGGSW